jgi:enoyl-CoA hydratase/carnithine racemase
MIDAPEALRLGVVREIAQDDVVVRGLELAERVAALPRGAVLETKRRTLLERRHLWGFLFEEERRVFARALLGPEPEPAA